jgi:hypothetical protein
MKIKFRKKKDRKRLLDKSGLLSYATYLALELTKETPGSSKFGVLNNKLRLKVAAAKLPLIPEFLR